MAGRTTTRIAVAAALVGAVVYFAPEALDEIGDALGDAVGANDAVTLGEGESALLVAANAKAKLVNCDPGTIVAEKSCDGLRVLVVDAARMPFIARNTKLAWESDSPAMLTMARGKQRVNRRQACGTFRASFGGQCDEYPMASTAEGGSGARTEEVPPRENQCQGPTYRDQYPPDGTRFLVVISHPDLVASAPYAGVDIAKDKGRC